MSVDNWVKAVFDRPVTEPAWYFDIDVPDIELDVASEARLYAETFERAGELLAPFSPEQLHQGLTYLSSNSCSEHMFALLDARVEPGLRLRALRSFVPLFRDVMAKVCSEHLGHLDEPGANPLNAACYMWWDVLPFPDADRWQTDVAFKEAGLDVMRQMLAIKHDAVRESALHGLGHWHFYYPREVRKIVNNFLGATRRLRPELRAYAQNAAQGSVQ